MKIETASEAEAPENTRAAETPETAGEAEEAADAEDQGDQGGDGKQKTAAESGFIITNSHVPETTAVDGQKTWEDDNDAGGKRPASITVNLLADGAEAARKEVGKADDWKWKFEDLPKYKEGKEISYTIGEVRVAEYRSVVSGYDIRNVYSPGMTEIPVRKIWEGGEPEKDTRVLIHLYRVEEAASEQADAGTDAAASADAAKAAEAEETDTGRFIELNAANGWKGAFTDLPVTDAAGKRITYTVHEAGIRGWTSAVTGDAETGFTVTNTREPEPETIDIPVTKVWEGRTGTEAVVHLLRTTARNTEGSADAAGAADASEPVETGEPLVLNADNGWKGAFHALPAADENGVSYVYTIREDTIEGYTVRITGDPKTGFTVINTAEEPEPGHIDIPVRKEWEGGLPASFIVVYLYRQCEDGPREDTGRFLRLSEENGWADIFRNMPDRNAEGKAYTYSVEEEPVEGFITGITGDQEKGFTVINTYNPPEEPDVPPEPPVPGTPPEPGTPPITFVPGPPPGQPTAQRVLGARRGVLGAQRGVLGAVRTGDDRYMYVWLAVMAGAAVLLAAWAAWTAKVRRTRGRKEGTR